MHAIIFSRSVAALFGLLDAAMPGAAEPDGAKTLAYAAVGRNAGEIATIGDSVYYFAELGMQEYENAKFVRQVRPLPAIGAGASHVVQERFSLSPQAGKGRVTCGLPWQAGARVRQAPAGTGADYREAPDRA